MIDMEIYMCTLALLTIALCAGYWYIKKQMNYFKDRGIPYLPGWPIIGNMAPFLFRSKHATEFIREIYNVNSEAKYIGALDFMRPVIVLRDLELIKTAAIKNFDNFPDHTVYISEDLDPLFGGSLFNIAGEKWKETRSLLSPAFTGSKMKAMYELMVVCGKNFVNYLSELTEKDREMIQTKDLFTKLTTDAIATCAFGISVDSLKNPTNEFYVFGKEATNLDGLKGLKFFFARSFPKLFKWLNMKIVRTEISDFFKNIIETTIKTRDEKGIIRPDMIQLMMNSRGDERKHLKLDITEMTAQAFVFFFGGFDTTSTQMCIIAHELAINPAIQKKLQEEIDEVMNKSNGNPSYEDIQGMLYLDAVFNESMRLHTSSAFLDRLCKKSLELPPALPGGKPYTIEAGRNIWIPSSTIHRDPKYYENPDKFDPERYFDKKITINDVMNLGFGIGPRSCLGNRFAIMETKILFVYLLYKFDLMANEKTCSPLKYSKNSFSIKPDDGFWLSIVPRNEK